MVANGTVQTDWQGADYAEPGVSDIDFTSDLITAVEKEFCVNSTRVYATGKSNGGGFVGLMTCDSGLTSKIRAFAPVAGAFYYQFPGAKNCTPSRSPVPIMEFHGEQDHTVRVVRPLSYFKFTDSKLERSTLTVGVAEEVYCLAFQNGSPTRLLGMDALARLPRLGSCFKTMLS